MEVEKTTLILRRSCWEGGSKEGGTREEMSEGGRVSDRAGGRRVGSHDQGARKKVKKGEGGREKGGQTWSKGRSEEGREGERQGDVQQVKKARRKGKEKMKQAGMG